MDADYIPGMGTATRQFLSFVLDDEVFALDVARIREILDRTDTTRIPRMPPFMRGALNLRGSVVPVVDLRVKFGLPSVEPTVDTCVIVLDVNVDDESTLIGAMVDGVREVFEQEGDGLEPPPRIGAKLDVSFIEGMARHDDEFLIVLDADRVFSADEIITIRSSVPAQAPGATGRRKRSASE